MSDRAGGISTLIGALLAFHATQCTPLRSAARAKHPPDALLIRASNPSEQETNKKEAGWPLFCWCGWGDFPLQPLSARPCHRRRAGLSLPGAAAFPATGSGDCPSNPPEWTDQENRKHPDGHFLFPWCGWGDLNPQAFADGF